MFDVAPPPVVPTFVREVQPLTVPNVTLELFSIAETPTAMPSALV